MKSFRPAHPDVEKTGDPDPMCDHTHGFTTDNAFNPADALSPSDDRTVKHGEKTTAERSATRGPQPEMTGGPQTATQPGRPGEKVVDNGKIPDPGPNISELRIGNQTLDLTTPAVMTILNMTPDSFFAGSRTREAEAIRKRARDAVQAGAAILDLGGYSSRPGAEDVAPQEELRRLDRALHIIRTDFPEMPVSLDTFRSEVARPLLEKYGPCLVNDITGGQADPDMLSTCARFGVPFLIMHMRGTPQTMQQYTDYDHFLQEISRYFEERIARCQAAGIRQIVLDPGFGFSKTVEQNYELLAHLYQLKAFGFPVLAGLSRKSMIWKPLGITPAAALNGTTALHWECLRQGADILRVHDTAEAVEVVRLYHLFRTGRETSGGPGPTPQN